jgi:MFS transporter, DHA2 family, glioxin efflux transporter
VPRYAPGVDPQSVISAGAGGLQEAFQGATLRGVREAYDVGLQGAWALIIVLFCVSFFCAFIPKWPGRMVSDVTKEDEQQGSSLDEKDETEAI